MYRKGKRKIRVKYAPGKTVEISAKPRDSRRATPLIIDFHNLQEGRVREFPSIAVRLSLCVLLASRIPDGGIRRL